ncbi:MAG: sigma-70 family RNA polymerase sigma factor [Oscillospiraceae bacterium]|nr:sigma-70 family RNA polymerase sigma factor [Oscillospiraceae bacterium]
MTDQQIIALLQVHDDSAAAELHRKYGAVCMRIAKKYLRQEDAEECVSDVMMQVWRDAHPGEIRNLEAYLVTVTKRTAQKYTEKAQAQKRGSGETAVPLNDAASVAAPETVEGLLDSRLLTEAVERFLDSLNANARTVFVAYYRMGLAPHEIAAKFGLNAPQVRVSLLRTRRKLSQYLKEEGFL